MIYPPLPDRPLNSALPFYNEQKLMREYSKEIDDILGNHRDETNEFTKKLIEFHQKKEVLSAISKIYEIKLELYKSTGVIL
jgi:hypothetical protein